MLRYFQPMPIERFILSILHDDRDAIRLIESWSIEREEIASILVRHFRDLGIALVKPLGHADLMYKNILFQLKYSPELRLRLAKIREEIERNKAKHARHRG